jgi:hypothetical protein
MPNGPPSLAFRQFGFQLSAVFNQSFWERFSHAVTILVGTAFFVLWFVLPRHRGLQEYMRR